MAKNTEKFVYEISVKGVEKAVEQFSKLSEAVNALSKASSRIGAIAERFSKAATSFSQAAKTLSGAIGKDAVANISQAAAEMEKLAAASAQAAAAVGSVGKATTRGSATAAASSRARTRGMVDIEGVLEQLKAVETFSVAPRSASGLRRDIEKLTDVEVPKMRALVSDLDDLARSGLLQRWRVDRFAWSTLTRRMPGSFDFYTMAMQLNALRAAGKVPELDASAVESSLLGRQFTQIPRLGGLVRQLDELRRMGILTGKEIDSVVDSLRKLNEVEKAARQPKGKALGGLHDLVQLSEKLERLSAAGVIDPKQAQSVTKQLEALSKMELPRVGAVRAQLQELQRMGVLAGKDVDNLTESLEKMTDAEEKRKKVSYGRSALHHMRIVAEAIAIYELTRMVFALGEAWVTSHRQMDWALAQFRINVTATKDAIDQYVATAMRLSFATGTSMAEVLGTSALATRLRMPELAAPSTQIEMLWGYQSEKALRDLFALRKQFSNYSVEQIMDVITRAVRAGSLSGSEIFDISETWGAFSRQFVMDLNEIAGLFTGLGTVLGETGGSLETFMRHLEQFYTEPRLAQLTALYTGTPTVTYLETGEEIRRPLLQILQDVAKLDEARLNRIAQFMPQDLGQKSRQYFNAMMAQWQTMDEVINRTVTDTYTFAQAVDEATKTSEVAFRRLETSFQAMMASIGSSDAVTRAVNDLAAGMNAVALRNMMRNMGWQERSWFFGRHVPIMPAMIGVNLAEYKMMADTVRQEARSAMRARGMTEGQIISVLEKIKNDITSATYLIPPEITALGARKEREWIGALTREFFSAPEFDPAMSGIQMAQAFYEFMIQHGKEIAEQIAPQAANAVGAPPLVIAGPGGLAVGAPPRAGFPYKYGETPSIVIPQDVGIDEFKRVLAEKNAEIAQSVAEYNKSGKAAAGVGVAFEQAQDITYLVVDNFGRLVDTVATNENAIKAALAYFSESANRAASTFDKLGEISLPELASFDASFMKMYQRVRAEVEAEAARAGIKFEHQETPVLVRSGWGMRVENLDPYIAKETERRINQLYSEKIVVPSGFSGVMLKNMIAEAENSIRAQADFYNKVLGESSGIFYDIDWSAKRLVPVFDTLGNVIGNVSVTADIFGQVLERVSDKMYTVLGMQRVSLPEGITLDEFADFYMRAYESLRDISDKWSVGTLEPEPMVITDQTGLPIAIREFDARLLPYAQEMARSSKDTAGNTRRAAASLERLTGILDDIISAIPGVRSATPVTGLELFYQKPRGLYQDKFDELVRRARADIDHLIAGRPLEYGLGTLIAPDIFSEDIMSAIQGLPSDQMAQVLKDLLAEYERQFYGGLRPVEEYDKETFLAGARRVVDEKLRAKANQEMYRQWLREAGLGEYSAEILALMDQAPLVQALTGGKIPDEVQRQLAPYVDIKPTINFDDMQSVFEQSAQRVDWGMIIAVAIKASAEQRQQEFLVTGQLMGSYLAEGAGSVFMTKIMDTIYRRLLEELNR